MRLQYLTAERKRALPGTDSPAEQREEGRGAASDGQPSGGSISELKFSRLRLQSVRGDLELPVAGLRAFGERLPGRHGRRIGLPRRRVHGADGGPAVGPRLLEAAEVVGADQQRRGFVHPVEVKDGVGAEVGEIVEKRVFHPVQKITIFASACVEAGVEVRPDRLYPEHDYLRRQDGI